MVMPLTTVAQMTCSWKLPTYLECDAVFHSRRNKSHKRKWWPGSEAEVREAQSSEASGGVCRVSDRMLKREAKGQGEEKHVCLLPAETQSLGVFALLSKLKEMDRIQLSHPWKRV